MSETNGNGNGTAQRVLLGGVWAVLLLLAGWIATNARDANVQLQAQIQRNEAITQSNSTRITTLEAWIEYQQRQLDRIEQGVDELKKRR